MKTNREAISRVKEHNLYHDSTNSGLLVQHVYIIAFQSCKSMMHNEFTIQEVRRTLKPLLLLSFLSLLV